MRRVMTVGSVLFFLRPCMAQMPASPAKLSLPDAVERALKKNPSLQRVEHLAGAAEARIRQAEAGHMPSLAIQGAATNGPAGAPAFGSPGAQGLTGDPLKSHYGSGLNLILPLYDFGRTQHLAAARRALFKAAREDVASQQAAVILSVQEAYLDVLRRQQIVTVQQANVRQREATVTQAKALVEAGLRADVDLQLAQANLADGRSALVSAENDVKLAFAALNSAMGDTSLTEYTLEPAPTPSRIALSADELMRSAIRQRPELLAASLQLRSADQSVKAAQSELAPRIDSIASAGYVNPSKLISENKPFAVGVLLTIPIFTGGAVEGRIAEEKERRLALAASQRELEEAVKLQVARALVSVRTHEALLKTAQDQATAARSSREQATERYRLQLNSFEELLGAETAAVRAETNLVNAQFDLDQARAELDWATGATLRLAPPTRKEK